MGEEQQNSNPENYAGDYSDQYGDYSKEYDEQYGGYPDEYENQYRESDADYASEHQHKREKNADNYRKNASDETWARWEGDVDDGKASKGTEEAVNQRREGQNKVAVAAGDASSPQYEQLTEDKGDCLVNKKDCAGVCWGASTPDEQGGCCLDHQKDCAGVCFGDSIWINKNGTQYGTVTASSSSQGDWKCCSRSSDSACCQNKQCSGGCPEEGAGGKAVYKDGEMCVCDPKKEQGCCGDGSKDCENRCPHEENFGEGCQKYAVMCSNNGNGYECKRHPEGRFYTEQDCHWHVGSSKNQGLNVECTPQSGL
mgnify:CR=1 FL=1|jgi:hypothetical protein